MNLFMGIASYQCCLQVRNVYVPNLPPEWEGRMFSSERRMMLETNIRPSDYQTEVVWRCAAGVNADGR